MKIKLQIPLLIGKQGDYMVAYCPALELSSFGETEKEAERSFDEALQLFLKETHERGTLEKCLLDLGWSLQKKPKPIYTPPLVKQNATKGFESPVWINEQVAIPY